MTARPRVSVVVPFFDTPPAFISEAVDSVLRQTYSDWEVLLVDDGSSDPSMAVARALASEHSRVRYLEHAGHANRGQSAARNLGFASARGEYFALLDADDVWLPHKLEEQVAMLDANPGTSMLYGNTLYWHSWMGGPSNGQRDYLPILGIPPGTFVEPPGLLTLFLQGRVAVPCTCSILARREVVEAVGGFEESARAPYGDQIFYAKICLRSSVLVTGACWDLYRQRSTSLSHSPSAEQQREYRRFYLQWLEGYLSDQAIEEPTVWQALRHEQWKNRHPALARWWRRGRRLARHTRRVWPVGNERRADG